eukprot:279591_1
MSSKRKKKLDSNYDLASLRAQYLAAQRRTNSNKKDSNYDKKVKKQSRKSSESPNLHKQSNTLSVENKKKTNRKKRGQSSLTTDDYIPEKRTDSKTRPATARISSEKNRKNNTKNNSNTVKELKKMSKHKDSQKDGTQQPQMTMQQQAAQALCITAHKQLVQVFIEQTEN